MLSVLQVPDVDLWWVVPVVCIITGSIAGAMAFVSYHQASIERLVEQELTPMIADQENCESCRYSLDGLPKIDDTKCCPECGHETLTVPRSILDDLEIERVGETPPFRVRPRP